LLHPDHTIDIIDAKARRIGWKDFTEYLRDHQPHYYLTHVTAPTLIIDMYGIFLAKSLRAVTIAFCTQVTPLGVETMRAFPALDFVLRGELEATLRELVDTFETARGKWTIQDNQPQVNR
jgi:hypothetical protein